MIEEKTRRKTRNLKTSAKFLKVSRNIFFFLYNSVMIRRKKILLNVFFSLLCSYSRSKGEEKVLKTKFAFPFSILISFHL